MNLNTLTDEIDALLPQTQCGECGFGGCRPYAEALAAGESPIDRCPPGGIPVLEKLAILLHCDPAPYRESLEARAKPPQLAVIDEERCIGCTKCIQACPTDAIIGTGKWMHVILEDACTGCGLCVPPCPVDCIDLIPTIVSEEKRVEQAHQWRERYQKHLVRMEKEKQEKEQQKLNKPTDDLNAKRKQEILEALARVKMKKGPM